MRVDKIFHTAWWPRGADSGGAAGGFEHVIGEGGRAQALTELGSLSRGNLGQTGGFYYVGVMWRDDWCYIHFGFKYRRLCVALLEPWSDVNLKSVARQ